MSLSYFTAPHITSIGAIAVVLSFLVLALVVKLASLKARGDNFVMADTNAFDSNGCTVEHPGMVEDQNETDRRPLDTKSPVTEAPDVRLSSEETKEIEKTPLLGPEEVPPPPDVNTQVEIKRGPRVLTRIQEFKMMQSLLADVKFVMGFDEKILVEQERYWLRFTPIECPEQRDRIKAAVERHCHVPVLWIAANEIEIVIRPNARLPSFNPRPDRIRTKH